MPASDYAKPVRYKVLAEAYLDDVHYPASTEAAPVFVDYAGHPGTALEPTDEEGRRRKAAYFAKKRLTPAEADEQKRRLTQGAFDHGMLAVPIGSAPPSMLGNAQQPAPPVEIPADWQSFNAGSRVLLAARLGAPDTVNTASAANDFIEAEIERRAVAGS